MATSEVESGFDVVPVAPEPSFIPLSQAAAFIASQRRISDFSRRGQDLLERTPWSNISEILFKAGVSTVASPGGRYLGRGNTGQGLEDMEGATKK